MSATAVSLLSAGLAFVVNDRGTISGLRGPKSVAAIAGTEIARRAALFEAALRTRPQAPALIVAEAPPSRSGRCCHCGDELPAPRTGGGCELCHAAQLKALRALGRLS